jgi:hypothetical protein
MMGFRGYHAPRRSSYSESTMRRTRLDREWEDLMSLCGKEQELLAARSHPRLLRLVSREIEKMAAAMGFSPEQIKKREFRAERDGDHIVRLILDDSVPPARSKP